MREGAIPDANLLPGTNDIGKTLWEIGYLNMTEADWVAHRALLDGRLEYRNMLLARRNPAGQVRWARLSGRPLQDADARFIGYHGIGHGVTEQIEAERGLKDSEAELRMLMESVPVSIGHFDAHLRLPLDHLFGSGAFAAPDAPHPVLIILDLNLPKVAGLDVLRRVRAKERTRF